MRVLLPFALAAAVLAGCGGGGSANDGDFPDVEAETAPGADGVITMTGSDTLKYNTSALEAPAGEVGFQLTCGDAVEHNIVIEGVADEEPIAECDRGATGDVGTVTLEPGAYAYFCSIPGHKITMNGGLVVE